MLLGDSLRYFGNPDIIYVKFICEKIWIGKSIHSSQPKPGAKAIFGC